MQKNLLGFFWGGGGWLLHMQTPCQTLRRRKTPPTWRLIGGGHTHYNMSSAGAGTGPNLELQSLHTAWYTHTVHYLLTESSKQRDSSFRPHSSIPTPIFTSVHFSYPLFLHFPSISHPRPIPVKSGSISHPQRLYIIPYSLGWLHLHFQGIYAQKLN